MLNTKPEIKSSAAPSKGNGANSNGTEYAIEARELSIFYGNFRAVREVSMNAHK